MGPTELLSGSHFLPFLGGLDLGPGKAEERVLDAARSGPSWERQSHAPSQRGTPLAGPAGTIAVADFSILHRRGAASAPSGTRHMLKMVFWRTAPPQRDWLHTPGFELRTADYGSPPPPLVPGQPHVQEVDPIGTLGVRSATMMNRWDGSPT